MEDSVEIVGPPAAPPPPSPWIRRVTLAAIWLCFVFIVADFIYKSVFNITYMNREKCLIYASLPRPVFLAFEYFFELGSFILVGICFAAWLEKLFSRYGKFYPRNPVTAFLYGSLLPVCACTAIPLVLALRGKIRLWTLVTFVLAAPMLSPIILTISFSLLGWQYTLLRVAGAFVVSVGTGFIVERLGPPASGQETGILSCCRSKDCPTLEGDIVLATGKMFRMILPYLLLAGTMGILFEVFVPRDLVEDMDLSHSLLSQVLVILVGIPLYFCNGAEVMFLKPLVEFWGLPTGTAVAFSLTSTGLCVTSFVMLLRFLGKWRTVVLGLSVAVLSLAVGLGLNLALR